MDIAVGHFEAQEPQPLFGGAFASLPGQRRFGLIAFEPPIAIVEINAAAQTIGRVAATGVPDGGIDKDGIPRRGINGHFPRQRLLEQVRWWQFFAAMGAGNDARRPAGSGHLIEHDDGIDGQWAVTGKDKIAMPGALGKGAAWSLTQ